ncbi:MAG: hypothetical protein HY244_06200 [Rhizobiales bacterium]|nr:hypothetical protein [Hyphomicrobiales bacterium]
MYVIMALLAALGLASAYLAQRLALAKGLRPTGWMIAAMFVGPLAPAALYIVPSRARGK